MAPYIPFSIRAQLEATCHHISNHYHHHKNNNKQGQQQQQYSATPPKRAARSCYDWDALCIILRLSWLGFQTLGPDLFSYVSDDLVEFMELLARGLGSGGRE